MTGQIVLNDNQVRFFRTARDYDIVVDSGTWRSGKSFELCLFAILRMNKYPGITEFFGRRRLQWIVDTTMRKFLEILAMMQWKEGVHYTVSYGGRPRIKFVNGSSAVFGDLDTKNVNKWLSAEFSDVFIDEAQEVQEVAFDKIQSRQTQSIIEAYSGGEKRNKLLMAMNPPEIAQRHWTHSKFRDPSTAIPGATMIYSHIEANRHNIPTGYIESIRERVDKRTADIYLDGKWIPLLSSLVYPDFTADNVRPCAYNPALESFFSLDFGWTHPMSIGCWQYDRASKTLYRIYELVAPGVRPETYCQFMAGDEVFVAGRRYQAPFTTDTATVVSGIEITQRRQEADGMSNRQQMEQWFAGHRPGLPSVAQRRLNLVVCRPRSISTGIIAMRGLIENAAGRRRLFVDPGCRHFADDIGTYCYPVDDDGQIRSEEPVKDGIVDNTMDEARYLVEYLHPDREEEQWRTS